MDRRLIQTAVFGSADSDDPAVCPETVHELEAFRIEHEGQTIWCGTKFEGGCGRRLTTRLCTDKICHFAHYGSGGSAGPCGRTTKDKDSANHLFAKAHLSSWLHAQGLSARFSYPEPLGSAVIANLDDGRTLLVHLDRNNPVDWDGGYWEVILGPGVHAPANILEQRGYVQRLRFEDRPGGGRFMKFGTQHPSTGTEWDIPDDVTLTPEGMNTTTRPDAVRAPLTSRPPQHRPGEADSRTIVTIDPKPYAAGTVRQEDAVKLAVMHIDRALRENQRVFAAVQAVKRLLQEEKLPENIARLRIALDRGEKLLNRRAQERDEVLRQLQQNPTAPLLAKADMLMQDGNISAAEREILRLAWQQYRSTQAERRRTDTERAAAQSLRWEQENRRQQAERARAYAQEVAERRERAARAEDERAARAQAAQLQAEKDHTEKLSYLAPFVLGALKKAAREDRSTTWQEIGERTGKRELARLDHRDRLAVLEAVEKKTGPGTPLWSAVLAAAGTREALHLHRDLAERLQRHVPDDDTELLAQISAECALLRRPW
ncbi:hypothetical protein ACIO53_45190 [Streptomyces sp. NPDC087305]|uniref:hypothetical protein n=1 Tax=Streptomyces sp. NPDC087305 TaxID=3365781 RepID=UPI0037F93B76